MCTAANKVPARRHKFRCLRVPHGQTAIFVEQDEPGGNRLNGVEQLLLRFARSPLLLFFLPDVFGAGGGFWSFVIFFGGLLMAIAIALRAQKLDKS